MSITPLNTLSFWVNPWLIHHNPLIDWLSYQILSWEFPDLSKVPACYHDIKEVFSKTRATSLSPHRLHDRAIDLLPSTSPPKGNLYCLSVPETLAMKKYVDESLEIIRRFFFWEKDKTLRPCIDYRGLNEITI